MVNTLVMRWQSHPTRGAWIEMLLEQWQRKQRESHPTRGAWIEIQDLLDEIVELLGRTPHGVRGLKSQLPHTP